jgi:hypothetical protein
VYHSTLDATSFKRGARHLESPERIPSVRSGDGLWALNTIFENIVTNLE